MPEDATERVFAWPDDPWFAGFCDGEACFVLSLQANGYIVPRLKIGLRADDGALLEALRDAFGGVVYFQPPAPSAAATGSRPQYHWHVLRKSDLRALVAYFERFPLRSKKARDSIVWSNAVRIYCAAGGHDPQLAGLRDTLMRGRAYDRAEIEIPAVSLAQMELAC